VLHQGPAGRLRDRLDRVPAADRVEHLGQARVVEAPDLGQHLLLLALVDVGESGHDLLRVATVEPGGEDVDQPADEPRRPVVGSPSPSPPARAPRKPAKPVQHPHRRRRPHRREPFLGPGQSHPAEDLPDCVGRESL